MKPPKYSSNKASVLNANVDATTRTAGSKRAVNYDRQNGSNVQIVRASGYLRVLHIERTTSLQGQASCPDRFDGFLTRGASCVEHLNLSHRSHLRAYTFELASGASSN